MMHELLRVGSLVDGDVFHKQAQHPLAVFCLGRRRMPQARQVLCQGENAGFLLRRYRASLCHHRLLILVAKLLELDQRIIPALF
jgi:hypothetical protein